MLNKIKDVLTATEEVSLEQLKLENGTLLEAEKFEAGNEVFILTEDTKVALPVGEYQLESGDSLLVEEEGLIADLGYEKKEEDMGDKEEEEKEEMEDDKYVSKEEFDKLKAMVMEMKNGKEEAKEEEKEELSALPQEVSEALAQPAAEPIKHSPEVKETRKPILYSQNKPKGTIDRVLSAINNINK